MKTGRWASILPAALLDGVGLPEGAVALPITSPDLSNPIGLVVPDSNPMTALVQALFAETTRFEPPRVERVGVGGVAP